MKKDLHLKKFQAFKNYQDRATKLHANPKYRTWLLNHLEDLKRLEQDNLEVR